MQKITVISFITTTVKPPNNGHFGELELVLIWEAVLI